MRSDYRCRSIIVAVPLSLPSDNRFHPIIVSIRLSMPSDYQRQPIIDAAMPHAPCLGASAKQPRSPLGYYLKNSRRGVYAAFQGGSGTSRLLTAALLAKSPCPVAAGIRLG
jgi:hypothetical protein